MLKPILCIFVFGLTIAQSPAPADLPSILLPTFQPVLNEVANILFPLPIVVAETPIAIRYVVVGALPGYTITAACHPTALGFLGRKDPIPSSFCAADPQARIFSYLNHRLLASQFPHESRPYAAFLQRNGLNPFSESRDVKTEDGWANVVADQLLGYLENDGWNSLGNISKKDFRQQYSDFSGYKPQNPPTKSPMRLRRPLRWQPLTQSADGRGRFTMQVHVTPHIGLFVQPLVLSAKEFARRRTSGPYQKPNLKRRISEKDSKTMKRLIKKLFERSQMLTEEQVALALWWDNKFFSVGAFVLAYQQLLKISPVEGTFLFMGEVMAQHDAVLLAWKEKVKHDLVRPPTMVKRFLKRKTVRAWKGIAEGVGEVKAEEWEPVIKIQPHSEFPSASAVICTATMDHLEEGLKSLFGKNLTIPAAEFTIAALTPPGSAITRDVSVRFNTLKEAARSCGESRLWSGVHFEPSVPAGEKLAEGLGKRAREHIEDLVAGRVPKDCARCIA